MVARLIRDRECYYPPAVPESPVAGHNAFFASNDPHGAKKSSFLRQISNGEDTIEELNRKEPKLLEHLWGNIFKESHTQVERMKQA